MDTRANVHVHVSSCVCVLAFPASVTTCLANRRASHGSPSALAPRPSKIVCGLRHLAFRTLLSNVLVLFGLRTHLLKRLQRHCAYPLIYEDERPVAHLGQRCFVQPEEPACGLFHTVLGAPCCAYPACLSRPPPTSASSTASERVCAGLAVVFKLRRSCEPLPLFLGPQSASLAEKHLSLKVIEPTVRRHCQR